MTQDYSNCRHESVQRRGFTRQGKQRFGCPVCGKKWTPSAVRRRVSPDDVRRIAQWIDRGKTQVSAARELGFHKTTINRQVRMIRSVRAGF